MKLTKEQIDRLRSVKIHHILHVPMNRNKVMLRCPCVNHNDNSPSFLLDSDNAYYCFGCGVRGKGAIDFTMDALGCDFNQALTELESML